MMNIINSHIFCLKWYKRTKNLVLILNLHEIILYVVGDMLVGLNDIDVTWVNLDDLFRALSSQQEVSTKV